MEISVRELKSRLSEYLRRVAAGEEAVVLSRGRPVARLAPFSPRRGKGKRTSEQELIERFRRLPGVRAGTGRRTLPKPLLRMAPGRKSLAEIVSEQRG